MRRTIFITLIALVFSAPLGLLAGAARGSSASSVVLTSVEVLTDRLDPIQGAVVRIDNGSTTMVKVTNVDGQSPWMSLDPSPNVSLVLADKTLPVGIVLGSIEEDLASPFAPDPAQDLALVTISRTQPLAVPVQIAGLPNETNNLFPPPGDHPHWRIAVPPASSLRFTLHAAALLDEEAIHQYAAYRGQILDPGLGYVRGTALVVPGIQLGAEGILLGIALLGDLPDGVVVDALNLFSGNFAPSGPALNVQLVAVHNDVAWVRVTGRVRSGHLALLARPAAGPARKVVVLRDEPPEIALPPDAGQGIDSACRDCPSSDHGDGPVPTVLFEPGPALVTDCEPEPPNPPPGWTCDIEATPNHCGNPVAGAKHCKVVRSRGPLVCRSAGSRVEATTGKTAKWKASFQLTGAAGMPLSSAGGFEYGQESTSVLAEEWTAQAGAHGLGECMRYYRFELVCAQALTYLEDTCLAMSDGFTTWADCSVEVTSAASCSDSYTSQSTCSRTP